MIHAVLTIDDVASRNTPAIVDYLNAKGIQAILFAVGRHVEKYPEQAVYALQHGMIIGNHSYSHPAFSKLTKEEGADEIERCETVLDALYRRAGTERRFRPFRFPYGDKGGNNKAFLQQYLAQRGFHKVKDTQIEAMWWKEQGLDRDIDTLWTFDFAEYNIRQGSGFTLDDVWKRIEDRHPANGSPLLEENSHHILLLHAHDETEALVSEYYRRFIDALLEKGVRFEKPAFREAEG